MGDRWHIEVDRSVCIGSAQCVHQASGTFRLDSARQSRSVTPDADAGEQILQAAENCPAEAIAITLAASGGPVSPPEE